MLGSVTTLTEKLNIAGRITSSFRKWNNMIELQKLLRPAFDTFASIAIPNKNLNIIWNRNSNPAFGFCYCFDAVNFLLKSFLFRFVFLAYQYWYISQLKFNFRNKKTSFISVKIILLTGTGFSSANIDSGMMHLILHSGPNSMVYVQSKTFTFV